MEAASAGFVGVAKIFLASGAGINTHSNEFKESALTLACYKGLQYWRVYKNLDVLPCSVTVTYLTVVRFAQFNSGYCPLI
jgi:hypothetical protein